LPNVFSRFSSGSAKRSAQNRAGRPRSVAYEDFPSLAEEPARGIPLTGPVRGFWKYRAFLSDVSYRIGYLVNNTHREVIILAAGPRGGFYEHLRRRTKT